MKGKVCVFGSFNIDIVARVKRFPYPGESLVANSSMTSAGGKGANQATAALNSGANVHYIGKIGNDEFGQFARRHLKAVGFNVLTLLTSDERPTGNALIYVAEGQADKKGNAQNMISVDPGANMTVTDEEIARCAPSISCATVLLVQLENNTSAIEKVIDIGHQNHALVILNPAPWQPFDHLNLQKVDVITANLAQIEDITAIKVNDHESAGVAANWLHQKGCKTVVITMDSMGVLLSEGVSKIVIPVFPSEPKDTTGSCDSFSGALAARLANGESMQDAVHFASAYTAVSIEKLGAAPIFDIVEVKERLLK